LQKAVCLYSFLLEVELVTDKIKTRDIVKDIKVVDKAGNVADRMKNAYIRTKYEAQYTQQSEHNSPSEYATDNATRGAEKSIYKTGHQVKRQTGEIIDKAKEVRNTQRATEKTIKTAPKLEKTIKQSEKSTGKAAKTTAKATIKTTQRTIKTAGKTAKATIKTSEQAAKAAAKTVQITAKATKVMIQSARVAAKAAVVTAKATVKGIAVAVKATIAAVKGLVSLIVAGGWVAVVIILIICMAAMIFASPFGILSGSVENGTPTIKEVISTVNSEWDTKIEQLKTDAGDVDETVISINDTVVTSVHVQNWADILSVYSVKTSTEENPIDVVALDINRISVLKSVFNDMNTVTSKIEETTDKDYNVIKKLTIEITSKNYNDIIFKYSFNTEQQEILRELMSEGNKKMWQQLFVVK
jgi:hypothetical protein